MKGILLTDTLDLQVKNGTLQLGETREQEALLILSTEKGEWKEHPFLGAGLIHYLHSGQTEAMLREVKVQLRSAGLEGTASIENGNLKIDIR